MGIRYFVFAVNKMDLVGYDEQRFTEIAAQIGELEKELHLENVVIIPVSATEGDNVTKKSANMTWYTGEVLLPYLEQVDVTADAAVEQGFYLPVQRVCRPNQSFRGFAGQIESGSVTVGDTVTALPRLKPSLKSTFRGFWQNNRDRLFRLLLVLCILLAIAAVVILVSQLIFGDVPLLRLFRHTFDVIGTENLHQGGRS